MPLSQQAYLVLVLSAFAAFIGAVGYGWLRTNLPVRHHRVAAKTPTVQAVHASEPARRAA